jgi:DNA-binding ferritin-like protein (Dps family)
LGEVGFRFEEDERTEGEEHVENFLKKMIGDKKEWKRMEARAEALPSDYRIVYGEIKKYMWKFTAGDGMDVIAILNDLLGLFETGAADGRRALEVTGEDVAAFCDELLRNAKTYTENWRTSLNRDVMDKLREEEKKQ